jgi:glutamyl-tRNA synthetase
MLHTVGNPSKHSGLMSQVVTRFAPSPTGYLHYRGTCAFQLALPKTGGKMLLRIEGHRSRTFHRSCGCGAGRWFEVAWPDLGWRANQPVWSRSQHAEVAQSSSPRATHIAYCSPAELDQMREEARAAGKPPLTVIGAIATRARHQQAFHRSW